MLDNRFTKLTQKEIKNQLLNVNPQLCAIFAARCSLRALPFLVKDVEKRPFWYWKPDQSSNYLLAIFRAQHSSVNSSILSNSYFNEAATSATANTNAAAAYTTATAAAADYAAYIGTYVTATTATTATHATEATYATDATKATKAATDTATAATKAAAAFFSQEHVFVKDVLNDLQMITKVKNLTLTDFLYSSLWKSSPSKEWRALYKRFNESLLALNEGFEIWVDWYKDRINGIPLNFKKEKTWLEIPPEFLKLDAKAINAYLAETLEPDKKPLNIVRAIFIGDGAVGKTSVIKRLFDEEVKEGKQDMTPGIEIRKWEVEKSDLKASFWDFGGQVMAHSTHQFFLRERCLYVLIVDGESEKNKRDDQTGYGVISINDQAEYWLEHIKAFGKSAPVMLVVNKIEKYDVNLDMGVLREKYENILGYYPISCTDKSDGNSDRFKIFKDELSDFLIKAAHNQVQLSKKYFDVLDEVVRRSEKKNFLKHSVFNRICKDFKINKSGIGQDAFLELLDILGVIIHFKELVLNTDYVLNPRWLTHGIYALLYSKRIVKQQGKLSEKDVHKILNKKKLKDEMGHGLKYPKKKCRFIIDAMHKFELCYRLPGEPGCFIIPGKLPEKQPEFLIQSFNKKKEGTLTVEYDFTGLLPSNIIANFIVSRHHEIKEDNDSKPVVWQHGVLLYNKDLKTTSCFQVDYNNKKLFLWLQDGESRKYLLILRDVIYRILDKINLQPDEYVHLPSHAIIYEDPLIITGNGIEKITYLRLLKEAKRRKDGNVIISDSGNNYDLKKVLGFIMTKKQQKKEKQTIINKTKIKTKKFQGVIGNLTDSNLTQNFKMNVNQNDFESLKNELLRNNIEGSDISDLEEAINSDPTPNDKGKFGKNVNDWIRKMMNKAIEGSWVIGLGAAGNLLADAISAYYGLG